MSDESAEPGLTPDEWQTLARTHVFVRGLLRMRQAGAGDDPERFWQQRQRSIRITSLVGGFITFLAVTRLIPVPVARYLVGLVAGYISMGLWTALYGFTLMFLMGLRKVNHNSGEDQNCE